MQEDKWNCTKMGSWSWDAKLDAAVDVHQVLEDLFWTVHNFRRGL